METVRSGSQEEMESNLIKKDNNSYAYWGQGQGFYLVIYWGYFSGL